MLVYHIRTPVDLPVSRSVTHYTIVNKYVLSFCRATAASCALAWRESAPAGRINCLNEIILKANFVYRNYVWLRQDCRSHGTPVIAGRHCERLFEEACSNCAHIGPPRTGVTMAEFRWSPRPATVRCALIAAICATVLLPDFVCAQSGRTAVGACAGLGMTGECQSAVSSAAGQREVRTTVRAMLA